MNTATGSLRPVMVFVGPPGSGKSTVGRVVARRLGVAFTDTDELIEERAGKSIADIFAQDGEKAFRVIEREIIAEALGQARGVLALGGGAVLAEQTRTALRDHRVVYLRVELADGLRRTGMSTARPLLAGVNPRATFRALLEARVPLYREVATVEVGTARRSANQVATAVLAALADPALGERALQAPSSPAESKPGDPLDEPTPRDEVLLPDPVSRDQVPEAGSRAVGPG
ncbi:shikimate kinase [Pseudonocardia hispaniensis]|uniref:Shikimate kinase n=1 Tax=Pseudonocardia hispaniensis TaxID=904933 RepID=A0ABW1J122_9PSEU